MKEVLSPLFAPACLLVRDNSAAHLAELGQLLEPAQHSPGTRAQAGHARWGH